ncbi:Scr1 family TA system antitoxin-like transcriptional regulator [Kitasatospora sp. NPDC058170]|uniref:helix-turn-helix domain-containing protein n=1 Tax=Kitasatospora sp. NPDC058170 TaxID=3346364 RepID=UPI0036DC25FC
MAWRYCGNQIKLWRTHARISREELAKEAGYVVESLRSMEAGRRRPSLHLLHVADELCGAKGILAAGAEFLKPEKYPHFAEDFMRHEAEAVILCNYQNQLIPGLLQTEETARALMNSYWPRMDDETVEERVAARLERQAILRTQTKSFNFLVGEAALHHRVGTADEHRRQLRHLLTAGEPRHVQIQVVPAKGAHPGLDGPFVLLETAEHERLGYEEGQAMALLFSDPSKVSLLSQRHEMILRQALNHEDSARFIGKLAEEL